MFVSSTALDSSFSAMSSSGGGGNLNGDKGVNAMDVDESATSGANAASKDDLDIGGGGGGERSSAMNNDDEAMEEEEEEEVDDDEEDNGEEEEDAHGKRGRSEVVGKQKHS